MKINHGGKPEVCAICLSLALLIALLKESFSSGAQTACISRKGLLSVLVLLALCTGNSWTMAGTHRCYSISCKYTKYFRLSFESFLDLGPAEG